MPSSLPMTAHQSQNIALNEGHHGLQNKRATARSLRTPPGEQRELPLLPSCRNSAISSFSPHEILSPNLRFFTVNYSLAVNFSFVHAISTRTFEVWSNRWKNYPRNKSPSLTLLISSTSCTNYPEPNPIMLQYANVSVTMRISKELLLIYIVPV
jgi:hypothetical protein